MTILICSEYPQGIRAIYFEETQLQYQSFETERRKIEKRCGLSRAQIQKWLVLQGSSTGINMQVTLPDGRKSKENNFAATTP